MKSVLEKEQIPFEEQVPLCDTTIADFFLESHKIAIFCDGVYWHSSPDKQKRDRRQTKILQENDITVLRFCGSKIRTNIESCLSVIKEAISK